MKLIISLSVADGFLKNSIPTSAIEAEFSLTGKLSRDGFAVTGSGQIEVLMPTHIVLGPLEIQSICFVAQLFNPDPVQLELSAGLKFSLGPLVAVVERMGATGTFKLPAAADGSAGPVDFQLGFKPPKGVGLSIDAGVVSGGGYLFFDSDRGEYAGAIELTVADLLTAQGDRARSRPGCRTARAASRCSSSSPPSSARACSSATASRSSASAGCSG